MSNTAHDKFTKYYTNELSYLRQAGQVFAKVHPQAAKRLDLSEHESSDPHTERLLESFAFMTARLNQHIDNSFAETAASLYQILYPHMINPMPSMAIAQFQMDPNNTRLTKSHNVPKGAPLYANAFDDVSCRFQTVYPVTLAPIRLASVDFVHSMDDAAKFLPASNRWYIKLSLQILGNQPLSQLNMDELTFHIAGEQALTYALYECLFAHTDAPRGYIRFGQSGAVALPGNSIVPMGFSPDDMALPSPPHSTHVHGLLQEYFHFPQKFMFFKIAHLTKVANVDKTSDTFEIYLPLASIGALREWGVTEKNFLLGCTPIVNLFKKVSDPLRLDHRKTEYRLIVDQRRDRTFEIYSIESVVSTDEQSNATKTLPSYFSMQHHQNQSDTFWCGRRMSAEARSVPGSDMMLSFVDLGFNPKKPPSRIVYANTLCTNRDVGGQLPALTPLHMDDAVPVSRIVCLNAPTAPTFAPTDGDTLWRMVSLLSTDHVSLTGTANALETLKERLYLYAATTANAQKAQTLIDDIQSIGHKSITRRIGSEPWRGFVNGLELCLDINAIPYKGSGHFLLMSVLRHYFALNVSMNSFVEMVVTAEQSKGEWMRWPALHGIKTLL